MKNKKRPQDSYAIAERHLQYNRNKVLAKVLSKDFDISIKVRKRVIL